MEKLRKKWLDYLRYGFSIVLLMVGLAGIPDDIETWHEWLGTATSYLSHDLARWIFCTVAVLLLLWPVIKQAFIRLFNPSGDQSALSEFKGELQSPVGEPLSRLRIQFDVKRDIRILEDGAEILIQVENMGPIAVSKLRLSIEYIDPLKSQKLPETVAEIRNVPLSPQRSPEWIAAGETVIYKIMRGFREDVAILNVNSPGLKLRGTKLLNARDKFLFDEGGVFMTFKAATYKIQLLASADGAVPDRRVLAIRKRKKNGIIAELEPPVMGESVRSA